MELGFLLRWIDYLHLSGMEFACLALWVSGVCVDGMAAFAECCVCRHP